MEILIKLELLQSTLPKGVVSSFFNSDSLPELMQGAAGAIIALQVAFAIAIFTEIFKNKKENINEDVLDLHVVLDHVWKFKRTLFVCIVVFILPFFLVIQNLRIKIIIFSFWLIGFLLIVSTLFKLYKWVKGNGDEYRIKYLSHESFNIVKYFKNIKSFFSKLFLPNERDIEESWKSFWFTDSKSGSKDVEFFNVFTKEINLLIAKNSKVKFKIIEKLISDFAEGVSKRKTPLFTVVDTILPQVLQWHYDFWFKEYSELIDSKLKGDFSEYRYFSEIHDHLNKLLKFITEVSIVKGLGAYSYFKKLAIHFKKYESSILVSRENTEHFYLDSFNEYRNILEFISKSDNSYDIWKHYFPSEWKITEQNYGKSFLTKKWFIEYYDWAQLRIWQIKYGNWDKELDKVSEQLFPDVNPITWARILTCVFSPHVDNPMKYLILHKRTFGFVGRTFGDFGPEEEFEKKYRDFVAEQEKDTIRLAILLFGSILTITRINKWLEELKNLDYAEDSDENIEKNYWIKLLNSFLKYLNPITNILIL